MRNIIQFIRRFANLLFFLVLQGLALFMLFRYNRFHESVFLGAANSVTGKINEQYSKVEYYFQLKNTNEQLVQENLRLKNMLRSNFESPDSSQRVLADTIVIDTLGRTRTDVKFIWRDAKVVNNSVSSQTNTLTLHRGALQGIKKDMGVVGPEGVVGRVIEVGDNYSIVMSILHRQSATRAMLKKTRESGRVIWDGSDPSIITLQKIPKDAKLAVGDSVVTSFESDLFPEGILIGTIREVKTDKTTGEYILRLKTATNFFSVQYVSVIENLQKEEQERLEERVKKNK